MGQWVHVVVGLVGYQPDEGQVHETTTCLQQQETRFKDYILINLFLDSLSVCPVINGRVSYKNKAGYTGQDGS